MFAKERQDKIYKMIKSSGAVTTSDLVALFKVSIETIRRDLLCMEQQGLLLRVHGGAVTKSGMKPYLNLDERNKEFSEQKKNLALKAAEFISDGDIIAIDAGSTAILFSEVLKEKFSHLTIVTHSLDVFNILNEYFSVILCGGYYMREENSFYGAQALDMLASLHMQKAFLFPSALSLEYGICDYQKDLYLVQRQLLKSSEDIFVLADSSKFEKRAMLKLDDMRAEYSYITDCELSEELVKLYKQNNIKIYTGRK